MSDNGPEFASHDYNHFCRSWDIKHTTSSPRYPESNGVVERTIQTVKRTLKKAIHSEEDIHLALLSLKTAPYSNNQHSPAQLFFKRQPRNILPSLTNKKPIKSTKPKLEINKSKPFTNLTVLNPGDNVRLHDGNTWSRKGIIVKKLLEPRSYLVKTSGKLLRRNRKHILQTDEKFESDDESNSSLVHDDNPEEQPDAETDYETAYESDSSDATIPYRHTDDNTTTCCGRTVRKPSRFNS